MRLRSRTSATGRARLSAKAPAENRRHAAQRGAARSETTVRNVALQKERTRDRDLLSWLETMVADVRYALRAFRKAPGFTVVAVLSLALGIGANTAIFTLMNVAMLKSLPVSDPEALVMLTLQSGQSGWMHSRQELANGFRALGVTPGDTIMLHASVRAVGEVAGGPDQIHLALKDALTADGTLLMYASCPSYYDEVGRGALSTDEEREILEKLPPFDPLTARAQRENGALVEFLRTYPGSIVNHHVARFVVWGRHAGHLISRQPWNYAFGYDSALDRFVQLEGKILLLGCDHDNVTFLHYAEHIVDIPDKRVSRFKVPVLEDGTRVWRDMEEFDTSGAGAHHNWPDRFFARLVDTYLAQTGNRGGVVGSARSFLFDAPGLLELALSTMKAVAADPRAAANLVSA